MKAGSAQHKREFIEGLKREYQENIWKNELHLTRLHDEKAVFEGELKKLNDALDAKGKPAAAEEKRRLFTLQEEVTLREKEITRIQQAKLDNEYGLNVNLPKWEAGGKAA